MVIIMEISFAIIEIWYNKFWQILNSFIRIEIDIRYMVFMYFS